MERRDQRTARTAGGLFIIATVAGVVSVALLSPMETGDPGGGLAVGSLLITIMAAAIAMIPAVLYPVLGRHGRAVALGYLTARILEVVTILPTAVAPLLVMTLDAPGQRELVLDAQHQVLPVSTVFFCLSVVLLNTLLYRTGLVPRWISGWALVAVVPYLSSGLLVLFGVTTPSSSLYGILVAPLAVNEMVLAGWLLIRGFRVRGG